MLGYERGKKRIFIRILALIMAELFFATGLGYSDSSYDNKNIYSLYIKGKNLRVPLGNYGRVFSFMEQSDSADSKIIEASSNYLYIYDSLENVKASGEWYSYVDTVIKIMELQFITTEEANRKINIALKNLKA